MTIITSLQLMSLKYHLNQDIKQYNNVVRLSGGFMMFDITIIDSSQALRSNNSYSTFSFDKTTFLDRQIDSQYLTFNKTVLDIQHHYSWQIGTCGRTGGITWVDTGSVHTICPIEIDREIHHGRSPKHSFSTSVWFMFESTHFIPQLNTYWIHCTQKHTQLT